MQDSRSHQQQGGLGLSLATRPVWPNGDIHSAGEIITSRSDWVNEPRRIRVSKPLIERAARALSWVANASMLRTIGRRFYSAMEVIDARLHLGRRGGEGDEKSAAKKDGVDATGDAVTLGPVPATDVTDEQTADAKKWTEGDKGAANAGCTFDAEALATAAAKRRDDAVAAKKAEEEAAKRAEEAKRARTIDTDYFTTVLPDWFPIDEFEYKTEERPDYGGGTGNWSVTNFIRNGDANDNADFMIVTYEQGMPGYGCGYAKELGSSKGRTVQLLVGGVTAQEALGMSLEDYGDALAGCITLK